MTREERTWPVGQLCRPPSRALVHRESMRREAGASPGPPRAQHLGKGGFQNLPEPSRSPASRTFHGTRAAVPARSSCGEAASHVQLHGGNAVAGRPRTPGSRPGDQGAPTSHTGAQGGAPPVRWHQRACPTQPSVQTDGVPALRDPNPTCNSLNRVGGATGWGAPGEARAASLSRPA